MATATPVATRYELLTTVDISDVPPGERRALAEAFTGALPKLAGDYPTVKQYRVRLLDANDELLVGLRLEKPTDQGIEDIAAALIGDGMREATRLVSGTVSEARIGAMETTLA